MQQGRTTNAQRQPGTQEDCFTPHRILRASASLAIMYLQFQHPRLQLVRIRNDSASRRQSTSPVGSTGYRGMLLAKVRIDAQWSLAAVMCV